MGSLLCLVLFCFTVSWDPRTLMNYYTVLNFQLLEQSSKLSSRWEDNWHLSFWPLVFRELWILDVFSKAIKYSYPTPVSLYFFPKWNETLIDQAVLRDKILIISFFPETGVGIPQTNVDINEIYVQYDITVWKMRVHRFIKDATAIRPVQPQVSWSL